MVELIDLSHDIINEMPVHPSDDSVKLFQDKFLDTDEYNNFKLEIGMHAGTHIDTPMHMSDRGTFINKVPLENFTGKGCLLDVREEEVIKYKNKYSEIVNENDIVLLFTNHAVRYGKEDYYREHPVIERELAEFFIEKNIKILY
ncbi:MAG: cyclase family protein [bacterium]